MDVWHTAWLDPDTEFMKGGIVERPDPDTVVMSITSDGCYCSTGCDNFLNDAPSTLVTSKGAVC